MVEKNQFNSRDVNQQAGRDVTNNYHTNSNIPLTFTEQKLADLIKNFSDISTSKCSENLTSDLAGIVMKNKNEINKLSEDYFKHMQESSLPSFYKIQAFFKDPINEDFCKEYQNFTAELQDTILITRDNYKTFEELFDGIVTKLKTQHKKIDVRLAKVLLHYMYWNCDIGKKDDPAT